jgi:hypothetical protein
MRETLNRKIFLRYYPEQFVLIELENLWAGGPNLLSTGAVTHKNRSWAQLTLFLLYNEILSVCLS